MKRFLLLGVLLLLLAAPALAQAQASPPPGCQGTFLPGFQQYQNAETKKRWDARSAETAGVCQTRETHSSCKYTELIGDPGQPGLPWLCWYGIKAGAAATPTPAAPGAVQTCTFKNQGVACGAARAADTFCYFAMGPIPNRPSTSASCSQDTITCQLPCDLDVKCSNAPSFVSADRSRCGEKGSLDVPGRLRLDGGVSARPHPLSACFHQCGNVFEKCIASGKSVEECGGEVSSCAAAVCPQVDFSNFKLSQCGESAKDKYLACVKSEPAGVAQCRKELLGEFALCPDAAAYRFELLNMNIKVDRGDILARLKTAASVDIPTKAGDQEIGTLKVTAEKGEVKEVRWESKPIQADFSQVDPAVGKAEVKIDMSMGADVPERVDLQITPLKDEENKKAIEKEALKLKVKVKDVAYSVDLKTGLSIKGAKLTFKVDKAWADKHGTQNVKVYRQSDGQVTPLDTRFTGEAGGQATFEADTPGFSVFSVAAVAPAVASPPPTPTPKQPGFEALGALGAVLTIALVLRRKR